MGFAGMDDNGTQLYHMDPSGTYLQFDAKAIGSGSEGAQQSLQGAYHKSMTLKEATKSALTILKQVMEEKLNETNVEAARVTPQGGFHLSRGRSWSRSSRSWPEFSFVLLLTSNDVPFMPVSTESTALCVGTRFQQVLNLFPHEVKKYSLRK